MNCPYFVRYCNTCNKLLIAHVINFHKKKNGKYGLKSVCKECVKKENKQFYATNKEYEKERGQKYYHNNKEKVLKNVKNIEIIIKKK